MKLKAKKYQSSPDKRILPDCPRISLKHSFDWHILMLHCFLFGLLLWVYVTFSVGIFGYSAYHDDLNIDKAAYSPFIIAIAFSLLRNNGLPSYFYLNLILALVLVPSLVIFSGSNLPYSFIVATWAAFTIIALVSRIIKVPRLRLIHVKSATLLRTFVFLSILLIASIIALGGSRHINFNLKLVYQFREIANENLPGAFGYLIPSFSKVIIPTGIVLSIIWRKWLYLFSLISCSVMIFAFSGNRSPLFIPFVLLFVYWFVHYKKNLTLTLLALIAVVIVGGLDFYLRQSGFGGLAGWFGSLFIRRSLIVPAYLNWGYYDFFTNNPYNYWANSKLSFGLVEQSYDRSISHVIGEIHFGKQNLNANTGWIGSGMGQAGYWGVALYSFLIGLFLSFLDSYSKKLGYQFVTSVSFTSILIMTRSSDLITMLLTHGFIILLLIIIILQPDYNKNFNIGTRYNYHRGFG